MHHGLQMIYPKYLFKHVLAVFIILIHVVLFNLENGFENVLHLKLIVNHLSEKCANRCIILDALGLTETRCIITSKPHPRVWQYS